MSLDSALPPQPLATVGAQHLPSGGSMATRIARLELPQFKNSFANLSRALGGEGAIEAALARQLATDKNLARAPGPHKTYGLLRTFKVLQEASAHGDEHLLMKQWTEEFGGASRNFVVPNITGGWGEPLKPVFWAVVNNPTDHARLAERHVRKAPVYGLASYGKHFLAEVDATEWQRRRFGAIHTVATFAIKGYCPIMTDYTERLVARLLDGSESTLMYGAADPTPAFNMHELIADTAFKIAAKALFNADDDTLNGWSRKVRWALQRPSTTLSASKKILDEWADQIGSMPTSSAGPMVEALRELATDFPSPTDANKKAGRTKEQAQHDDILIVSLAMHDTTASTMTSCLMELARRPQLQDQVAAECTRVLAQAGPSGLNYDDLHKMPLLTKCLNETLRLWNAVSYGTMRQLDDGETITTDNGDLSVKRGTNCYLQNFSNHRSKELWGPDAEEWKPERWSGFSDKESFNFSNAPDDIVFSGKNPQSLRFHPFTRAPRDCFGKNFAQAEMRVVLPVLLSKFRFRLAEPTVSQIAADPEGVMFMLSGILKPRDGLWMHAEPRQTAAKL